MQRLDKKQHEAIMSALRYYEKALYAKAVIVEHDRNALNFTQEAAYVTDMLKIIEQGEYAYTLKETEEETQ